jgi:hypothetical protein
MAIKELFYDNRPRVLLDPRASQRIDPRFTFTRDSTGTYVDSDGLIKTAAVDEPRFDRDPVTGESLGLLMEESRTNVIRYNSMAGAVPGIYGGGGSGSLPTGWNTGQSQAGTTLEIIGTGTELGLEYIDLRFYGSPTVSNRWLIQPSGSQNLSMGGNEEWTSSLYAKLIAGSMPNNVQFSPFGGAKGVNIRSKITSKFTRITGTGTRGSSSDRPRFDVGYSTQTPYDFTIRVAAFQAEAGSFPTSYIPTSGSTVTRAADLLSTEAPLPATGSLYIDARAISANENDTLLSLKNSSNDKIDLAYLSNTATYNSLALIANYDGTSKSSLPLPVPTTDRERNIITYGTNNYQYGRDSSRFAPSLSSAIPTGLNKLSIGHDAVDPTKAFNGYINTVYAWSGELTPEVAEALVRGEIDAINADTYSPTGPAGSLALVINTQGAAADGEKTFTLPAESVANDNDIVITWGDGTESGLDGAAAELGAVGLTHGYPAAGIYPVFVEGQLQNIKYNNISNAGDLVLIAAWGTGDMFTSPSTMNGAFYGCSQMDFSNSARITNRPDTSAVTDWENAFRDCSSITGTFPSFDFTAATNFTSTWNGCSSLASMPAIFIADGDVTQNVTNFSSAWNDCSGLTSFPLIVTSEGTDFSSAWNGCSGLTSFPLIDTSEGTDFSNAWNGCNSLTSFPLINTSLGTNFNGAWDGCNSLTSFPLINTSLGTNFNGAWSGCTSLTSFALIDTSSGTNFSGAWTNCFNLTSFPLIDTSSGTSFASTWNICSGLTNFPLVDTSSGTNFTRTWRSCSSLTSFPLINTSSGTNFTFAWSGCSSLTDFPASFFDSWAGTPVDECFYQTWNGCTSLTATSVDNILVSIAGSGVSAPSGTGTDDKKITIDYDGTTLPGTTATAITTLKSRNWEIYLNDVLQ